MCDMIVRLRNRTLYFNLMELYILRVRKMIRP